MNRTAGLHLRIENKCPTIGCTSNYATLRGTRLPRFMSSELQVEETDETEEVI